MSSWTKGKKTLSLGAVRSVTGSAEEQPARNRTAPRRASQRCRFALCWPSSNTTQRWRFALCWVVFRFSGIGPAALFGAVGKGETRQRGGENAKENLSPERGVFCIFTYDSAVPKVRKGLWAQASRGQILLNLVPGGTAPAHQKRWGMGETSKRGRAVFGR
jgi:hypothetical protein